MHLYIHFNFSHSIQDEQQWRPTNNNRKGSWGLGIYSPFHKTLYPVSVPPRVEGWGGSQLATAAEGSVSWSSIFSLYPVSVPPRVDGWGCSQLATAAEGSVSWSSIFTLYPVSVPPRVDWWGGSQLATAAEGSVSCSSIFVGADDGTKTYIIIYIQACILLFIIPSSPHTKKRALRLYLWDDTSY